MAKASDILKELAAIGAVGNNPVIPVPVRVVPAAKAVTAPAPIPPSKPLEAVPALAGFVEQLDLLEEALSGMLNWCAEARSQIVPQSEELEPELVAQPEAPVVAPVAASESAATAATTEPSAVAAPVPDVVDAASTPVTVATADAPKAKKTIEQIRAEFFQPDALVTAGRGNGGSFHLGIDSTSIPVPELDPLPQTENTNG